MRIITCFTHFFSTIYFPLPCNRQTRNMGFSSSVCILFFFLGVKVYCQYESYQWDEDYDQEPDDVYQTEFHQI